MLLLALGCLAHALLRGGMGPREYALWIPIALIFLSNTLFNSLQIGVRHALPAYPLLFIAISPRVACLLAGWKRGGRAAALAAAAAFLLAWHAAGTLAVAPRYLQFFNELAGGAEGGHRWLIDSNIDWGQDLIRLREYLQRERIDSRAPGLLRPREPQGLWHPIHAAGAGFARHRRDLGHIPDGQTLSVVPGRPPALGAGGALGLAARPRADRARRLDVRVPAGVTSSWEVAIRQARPRGCR